MDKKIITIASLLGASGIILGALGAHTLKSSLSADQLVSFETAVRYHFYHALFLLVLAALPHFTPKQKRTILIITLLGVTLFSGSIYLLATQNLTNIDFSFLGPITPLGGIFMVVAWLMCGIYAYRQKSSVTTY